MLRKKDSFTNITPIPSYIPRQLALEILHNHSEIISLNPLVLDHRPTTHPRDAAPEEFYSTWYEITERVQYIPGVGKMGSGKVTYKGCFHDMPWGLQTHIHAPMSVELRNRWRIAGNQPGEPPEVRELGIGAPADGLYLREDVEIKANIAMLSFVKHQVKASSRNLVERLVKKADLLDTAVLNAMMERGRLRNFNPGLDRASSMPVLPSLASSRSAYSLPRSAHHYTYRSNTAASASGYSLTLPLVEAPAEVPMELPGDFYHPAPAYEDSNPNPPPPPSEKSAEYTNSEYSAISPQTTVSVRWSEYQPPSSRTSVASDISAIRSPGGDTKGFTTDLPTMEEAPEETERSQDSESTESSSASSSAESSGRSSPNIPGDIPELEAHETADPKELEAREIPRRQLTQLTQLTVPVMLEHNTSIDHVMNGPMSPKELEARSRSYSEPVMTPTSPKELEARSILEYMVSPGSLHNHEAHDALDYFRDQMPPTPPPKDIELCDRIYIDETTTVVTKTMTKDSRSSSEHMGNQAKALKVLVGRGSETERKPSKAKAFRVLGERDPSEQQPHGGSLAKALRVLGAVRADAKHKKNQDGQQMVIWLPE